MTLLLLIAAVLLCLVSLWRKYERLIYIYAPLVAGAVLLLGVLVYFIVRIVMTALSFDGLASSFFLGPPADLAWPVRLATWAALMELAAGIRFVAGRVRGEQLGWLEAHSALLSDIIDLFWAGGERLVKQVDRPAINVEHLPENGYATFDRDVIRS